MALVLLGCGCECTTDTDPCNCSGECTMLFRFQGGTATLCGWQEFAGFISSPQRLYRTKTFLGSTSMKAWNHSDCSGTFTEYVLSAAGVDRYDASSCAYTQGAVGTGDIGSHTIPDLSGSSLSGLLSNFASSVAYPVLSATLRTFNFVNSLSALGCYLGLDPQGDMIYESLSEEDTEEDAVARVPQVWTPWSAIAACSSIGPRAGLTFSFSRAQVRVFAKGSPGTSVAKSITYLRAVYGSTALADYRTDTVDIAIGSDGTGYEDLDIPLAYGYTTCVGSCTAATS